MTEITNYISARISSLENQEIQDKRTEAAAKFASKKEIASFVKNSVFYAEMIAGLEIFKAVPGAEFDINSNQDTANLEIARSFDGRSSVFDSHIEIDFNQPKGLSDGQVVARRTGGYSDYLYCPLFAEKLRPFRWFQKTIPTAEEKFALASEKQQIRTAHEILDFVGQLMEKQGHLPKHAAQAAMEVIRGRGRSPLSTAKDGIATLQALEALQGAKPDAKNSPG